MTRRAPAGPWSRFGGRRRRAGVRSLGRRRRRNPGLMAETKFTSYLENAAFFAAESRTCWTMNLDFNGGARLSWYFRNHVLERRGPAIASDRSHAAPPFMWACFGRQSRTCWTMNHDRGQFPIEHSTMGRPSFMFRTEGDARARRPTAPPRLRRRRLQSQLTHLLDSQSVS